MFCGEHGTVDYCPECATEELVFEYEKERTSYKKVQREYYSKLEAADIRIAELEKKNKQLLERNAMLQSDLNQAKRDAKWSGK